MPFGIRRTCLTVIFAVGFFLTITNCKTTEGVKLLSKFSENEIKQINALAHFTEQFVVFPGQVTLLKFPYFGPFLYEALVCNDREILFVASTNDSMAIAYVAPSYFETAENFTCQLQFRDNSDETEIKKLPIGHMKIRGYSYPKERLKVAQKKVVLSAEDLERSRRDEKMLEAIFRKKTKDLLFDEAFNAPLTSKITSIFGTQRIFNNKLKSEHLGTDFRAPIGTPVTASNSGRVVFAGDLFFGGNTVIIDHGLAIFTSYSHLSKISVHVGEKVTKKTTLGYSGMTGRVSGPHLHWGTKIYDHWVDGHSLIEASNKNFGTAH